MIDWVDWHADYENPTSALAVRLRCVQRHLADALDAAAPGPIRLLSLCAGQGRDVIEVLAAHPRAADVSATLVELNADNVADARRRADELGVAVDIRADDASRVASFAGVLPVDVLLLCGIFGNVEPEDIRRTVAAAPALCAAGATVIWTRHRQPPDQTVAIRAWFGEHGFDEVAFDALDTVSQSGVGVHRLRSVPAHTALPQHEPLFTFTR